MSDDYQLRKDIDKFKKFLNDLQALMDSKGIEDLDIQSLLSQYYDMSEVDISNSEINSRIDALNDKIPNVDININTNLTQLLMPNVDVTEVAYLVGNGVDTEQLNQLTENGYDISTIQYVYNSAGETYYLDDETWSLLDEFPSWLSDPVMGIKLDMISNVDKGGVDYNSEPFEYIFSVSDGRYWIHFDDAYYEMGDLNSFFQFTELYNVIKWLFSSSETSSSLLKQVYPVGSIYMSVNSVNPSYLFGFGTWERIEDKFLLGSGTTFADGSTGGSKDAIVVNHTHTTSRDYILATDGPVGRISTAGTTGTKVNNLLQANDGAVYRNTLNKTGVDGTNKNMPPYIAVNIWKRTE